METARVQYKERTEGQKTGNGFQTLDRGGKHGMGSQNKEGCRVEQIHQMDSFIIWNIRGLNGLNKQKEVQQNKRRNSGYGGDKNTDGKN